MKILKLIQMTGLLLCILPMLALGHQYYSHMTAPKSESARFVSATGESRRPAQGTPTFMESATIMINGMLGKEEKPKTGLAALKTRTNATALSYDDMASREMDFWMNFTSKLGFGGI